MLLTLQNCNIKDNVNGKNPGTLSFFALMYGKAFEKKYSKKMGHKSGHM